MPSDLIAIRHLCLQFLENARNTDGSWGYLPLQKPELEPTIYATAAGFSAPAFLERAEPTWGLLLLPALVGAPAPRKRALSFILSHHSERVEGVEGFDATLPGWSWVEGTAAWVEPTCWALLSLARTREAPDRQAEGRAMLLNRQCTDGGWNYGNPRVNGIELESMIAPTAWSILALRATGADNSVLERANHALDQVFSQPGCSSLALSALARHAIGLDPGELLEALAQRIGADGARGRVDWTALAVLALNTMIEGRNVFL